MAPRKSTSKSQQPLSFNAPSRIVKPAALKREDSDAVLKNIELDGSNVLETKPLKSTKPTQPVTAVKSEPKTDVTVNPESTATAALSPAKAELSADERAANKISEAQINRYWKTIEEQRKAPRIHQSQTAIHENLLRYFDISSQYGPSIGIARRRRWERAQRLGLNPPIEVLAVLIKAAEVPMKEEKKEGKKARNAALGKKPSEKGKEEEGGRRVSETSHIEELMGSRFVTAGEDS